jgi:hypothetical protein
MGAGTLISSLGGVGNEFDCSERSPRIIMKDVSSHNGVKKFLVNKNREGVCCKIFQ